MATATTGLTRTAMVLGVVVGALGALIVVAWLMRWEPVLRVHRSLPVMQFNTAILLIATGAGLMAGAREARRAQAAIGGLILLLAVPTFLQFPLDRSLGVDTLLWRPFTGSEGFALGRMAPSTAAALLLAGLAFVAGLGERLRSPVAGGAAAAILAMSGFALVEYLFGQQGSAWGRYARMAVHTASAVGMIGFALWCLAWRDGVRSSRYPIWLPWTGASAALVLTGMLATALTTVFPVEAWPLVLATTIALGLGVALLVYAALAVTRVAGERADQIEAASAALALSEVRHRAVFEQSSAGIIELGVNGELLRANRGFGAMVGRAPEELVGLRLSDITHPDDLDQDTRHFSEAQRGALAPEGWIKRYLRPDGGVVWAHVSGSLVHAPDGAPLYLVGVIHDVTNQVLAEERLRESETRFRSVAEMAAAGIVMADARSTIVFANHAAATMFGYGADELVGQPLTALMPAAYRDRHDAGVSRFLDTGISTVLDQALTLEGLRHDGSTFPIDLSISTWDVRGARYFTGIIRDVTARQRDEAQIRASLEEKEVLLREIHHRVKNNLAIIASLFYLESTTTDHPEALRVLAESRARIQSMALVHEFLYRSDRLSAVDFAEYATQLARQLLGSMQVGERAATLELATSPVSLPIDTAIPCGLILNEVLTNSLKHAFPAGRIPARPTIALSLDCDAAGVCTLSVSDNGVGIVGFDPEHGRTLGLRLMRSLAQQVGGAIHFDALSPGTRVRLRFTPERAPLPALSA